MKKLEFKSKLLTVFLSNLYISAFTFGGGYVIIGLMKKKYVDELGWFDEEEMLDITAIAQSCPGAIAVNTSILIGYKIAGIIGALAGVFGTMIPPLVIITIVSFFYSWFKENKYINLVLYSMQAGVAAVVVDVVIGMVANIIKKKDVMSIILMILGFIAVVFFNVNVILVIGFFVAVGLVKSIILDRKKRLNNHKDNEDISESLGFEDEELKSQIDEGEDL